MIPINNKHRIEGAFLCLLKRDETGAVGGTNSRPTVLDGLVRQGEFTQVETNHLRLDFDLQCNKNKPSIILTIFVLL